MERTELTGITVLRFYAAISVLLFHSRYFTEGTWLEIPFYALFSNGWMGVDIFFVLSGFVISYVYSENLQFGEYLIRRFARIYPIYFTTTLAALITLEILGSPSTFGSFDSFDIWMNFMMLQGWYTDWPGSINFVSWSVSAEFSVYLMFPLILFLAKQLPSHWMWILLPIGMFSLFGGFSWLGLLGPVNKCLFEFASGVMIFIWWKSDRKEIPGTKYLALVSTLLIVSVSPWVQYFNLPFHDRYLAVLALPIVYWALCTQSNNTILLLGGRASYSIYLVHGVVYLCMRRMVELGHLEKVWALIAFWSLSLGLAYATYMLVEKTSRQWMIEQWGMLRQRTVPTRV